MTLSMGAQIVKARIITILLLSFLLALNLPRAELPQTHAIGIANVVVTNVFWGTNPASPINVHPGDMNVQLSIVLTNVGDDVARSVNATLFLTPPIDYYYFVGGSKFTAPAVSKIAGDMQAGTQFTLVYIVSVEPIAREGINRYNLVLSYNSARELQQINKTVEVDVPIYRGELHVQAVSTNPVKMYPDSKAVQVTVTLANSGQGISKDVQVILQLKPPFAPSSSGSDKLFLGNLPPGQTSNANFVVDVAENATFGQYSILLAEAISDRLVPIGQVPLYVAEKVNFQILSINPSAVHPGDSGDVISVRIKNAGSVKAQAVRVELQVGNFFTGTLTDFLGDMLAGENKTALFTVDIDSKAPVGLFKMDLRFDWTQDNNALDNTYPISLRVQPAGPPSTLIAIVAIIVIAAGGYFFLRKRRAAKAAQQPMSK
jgi:hypothetical protein